MGLIPLSEKRLNYFGSCYSYRQNLLHVIASSDISKETAEEDEYVCRMGVSVR
jgi:hypothetical protein